MGITTRDLEIIRYLEKNFLINSDIASRLVYKTNNKDSSLNIAQRRLRELYKLKQVKRIREYVSQSYTYYIGKTPTKTEHRLMMTDLVSRLKELGAEIILEETEIEFDKLEQPYGVRPDILLTFNLNGRTYQALVEIDLTKTFTHADKYKKILEAKRRGELPMLRDYPLTIISVCDKKPDLSCIWIKTDWSNISNFNYAFIK